MQGDIVSGVLLPLILAFIMFSLGLGLTVGDFRRIFAQPRALLVGVVCHFVLLPLACFLLLSAWGMTGVFAVGFMILAACPTGSTSNLLTYLARGDVALALSFTAVASVATIFTLPLVVTWALGHYLGAARAVDVPVGLMMGQVATVLVVLIVVLAVAKNWALLRDNFTTLAPFALLLNISMLCVGFGVAWAARLSRSQSVTLGIETAVQNAALALVIASTVLQDDAMAIPGALYGVLMYAGGLLFALAMRRLLPAAPTTAPA